MVKMKKIVALLLVTLMMFSVLTGCNNSSEVNNSSEPSETETNQQDTEAIQETEEQEETDEWVAKDPVTPEELGSGEVKWAEEATDDGFMLVTNESGATLSYSVDSGVKLLQVDGYAFKDLNKNDMLDQYEDWREPTEARVQNLASILTIEDIAGLTLYSTHQRQIDAELNEEQIAFLDNGGRAVLNAASRASTEVTAKWNNALQAYAEGTTFGIPVNTSSDPRSTGISLWPSNLAMAATFDPEIAAQSAEMISQEYRLLGIGTYLGPQIDLSTEPRWTRNQGTFGSDPALSRDMTNAFVNGMQSTYDENGEDLGWGADSMNAMIKHWPGDGAGEGGRESHSRTGNTTVYPGDAFETHLIPFVDAALSLEGKTESATSVMASYSIAYSDDEKYGVLKGSAFSEYKINELLRGKYGYEGVVCTDWVVINGPSDPYMPFGWWTSWGATEMTTPERIYTVIMAGVDQFGGYNSSAEVLEAYEIGIEEIGEEEIDARFRVSAARLLRNVFTIGLFENSYINVDEAINVVNNEEFVAAGYDAQVKSVVMLKNENDAIKASESDEKPTVYIPMTYTDAAPGLFGPTPALWSLPVDIIAASEYFTVVTDTVSSKLTGKADADGNATPSINDIIRATPAELAKCDYALPIIENPKNVGSGFGGYGYDTIAEQYIPLSLQYGEYKADSEFVRKESISGEIIEKEIEGVYGVQIVEEKENRSYFGQTAAITNAKHLDSVLYVVDNMPEGKPVIVAVKANSSFIPSEFESKVDAIVVGFGINDKALFDIVTGKSEPSGLLPLQFPKDMLTVEAQFEDVPRDMECYVDSTGNTYDFAFGLNWSGVIDDERVQKYNVPTIMTPANKGN